MLRVQGIEVTGIHVMNSPYYHIQMIDCKDGWFHDMRISVSMWGTLEFKLLLQEDSNLMFWANFASLDLTIKELPSVPTNTDGIDVNTSDNSCFPVIIGCMDSNAFNYNKLNLK